MALQFSLLRIGSCSFCKFFASLSTKFTSPHPEICKFYLNQIMMSKDLYLI
jgi:hypothetical protein